MSTILNALPCGVLRIDPGNPRLQANAAAARILGLDQATLQGGHLPEPWSSLVIQLAAQPAGRHAMLWARGEGDSLWLEVSNEPLPGGGALVSFEDVTVQRVQSRRLERLTELYAALSQVNQAIVWSSTPDALLDKICEVMVRFGKFAMAWIAWDDPETHEVRVRSQFGDEHGYLKNLRVRSDDSPLGRGCTGTVIREGRPCVVNDLLESADASPWQGVALSAGYAASAGFPIPVEGRVGAVLMVYASEPGYFGPQELSLLQEAAGDVAFGLSNHAKEARRKQLEAALTESEHRFRTLFETMHEGVALHELVQDETGVKDYRFVDVNPAFQRHTGLSCAAVRGCLASDLFAVTPPLHLEEFSKVAQGGEPLVLESDIPFLGKYFRISVVSPRVGHFATVLEDVSGRKKAELEIRRLNEELEQRVQDRTAKLEAANKEMEAFSYSVSHDLRAPLRSIDGFSQVVMEDYQDQLDEAGKHYLARIRHGAQHMGQLIDDLLKLSKTNRSALNLTRCDLSRICHLVAQDLTLAAPDRQVEIVIQPDLWVRADPHLIQVVMENLLGNAWKFTTKTANPRIEVGERTSPAGERIIFIQDNGAGFDMAHADKLFNAFQRLHSVTDFEGTGIGLAIVQRIIHRHGGWVTAEAKLGEGATFSFSLPDPAEG
ncbi:MAG: GAF domain-containing protein [Holophaga sp.]|nr:GAF domain-containing protein [Holophaga sp.]